MASLERAQYKRLKEVFTERFFHNDLLGTDIDLRRSMIWLIAVLMVPGMFLSFKIFNRYGWIARLWGPDRVMVESLFEKTVLVGFGMTMLGLVCLVACDALWLDRRDSQVLAPLPVRGRVILAAKAVTLFRFWLIVSLSINVLSAAAFSLVMGGYFGVARYFGAHMLTMLLASACVFGCILTVQGITIAVSTATTYRRLIAIMQAAGAAVCLSILLLLPRIGELAVAAAKSTAEPPALWLFFMPPLWFTGLYEIILGTPVGPLHAVGQIGIVMTTASVLLATITTVVAYRRHLRQVQELSEGGSRTQPGRRGGIRIVLNRLVRRPETRSFAVFVVHTLTRSARHRLLMAGAFGVALGCSIVAVLSTFGSDDGPGSIPPVPLLAIPLMLTYILLLAIRSVSAVPAELVAAWVFHLHHESSALTCQEGIRAAMRIFFVPAVLGAAPLYMSAWGAWLTCAHLGLSIILGHLLIEIFLWKWRWMPMAVPDLVGLGGARMEWPTLTAGFVVYSFGFARLEAWAFESGTRVAVLATFLTVSFAVMLHERRRGAKRMAVEAGGLDRLPDLGLRFGTLAFDVRSENRHDMLVPVSAVKPKSSEKNPPQ